MLSNDTVFEVISAKEAKENGIELTGAVGVTKKTGTMSGWDMLGLNAKWLNYEYGYFDHVYVSMDKEGRFISESWGRGGIELRSQRPSYIERTSYYLKIKLIETKKLY